MLTLLMLTMPWVSMKHRYRQYCACFYLYDYPFNRCLCSQVSSLIAELASAAAAEKGLVFEEAMEDRLCAYSRAVAHFPTAVKEVTLCSSND